MIVYSIFDTTNTYTHILSSVNLDDIYTKLKSHLEIEIDYDQFKQLYHHRVHGRIVHDSDKNFKSALVLIDKR